jgi:hypothetical protein
MKRGHRGFSCGQAGRSAQKYCVRRLPDFTPSPRDPLLMIKLCVEGTGTAWFDDLELVEVAR